MCVVKILVFIDSELSSNSQMNYLDYFMDLSQKLFFNHSHSHTDAHRQTHIHKLSDSLK